MKWSICPIVHCPASYCA